MLFVYDLTLTISSFVPVGRAFTTDEIHDCFALTCFQRWILVFFFFFLFLFPPSSLVLVLPYDSPRLHCIGRVLYRFPCRFPATFSITRWTHPLVQRPTLLSSRSRPTEKLELPSISQVHTRGPAEIPWYNHHAAERPLLSGDKLPALSLPTAQPYRSHYPDPSVPASNTCSARTSLSGPAHDKTTPPPSDLAAPADYPLPNTSDSYYPAPTALSSSMNHTPPYMDVHSSHLSSAAQPYASQAAPAGGIPHYSPYSQQPPVLQPASTTYGPASSYSQYGYPGSVASPQSAATQPPPTSMSSQMPAQLLPLPGEYLEFPFPPILNPLPHPPPANCVAVTNPSVAPPGYGNTSGAPMQGYVYDTTGQMAPPGAKPRVTATLWEDEGSLCYQVEAKGVCVARREDNHMINGTKLLNVAGMTRGRRDGILKSEKIRHVVKIGPMHLKGVW